MRIHFVNDRFDPQRSEGTRAHIEGLTQALTAAGHEVWSPFESANRFARRLPVGRLRRWITLATMDVFYVRVCAGNPRMPNYMHPLVRRILGNPRVVWEVNATIEYCRYGEHAWPVERLCAEEQRRRAAAPGVALAICNTEGLARYARELGVRRTTVVPLGADPGLFGPAVPPDPAVPMPEGVFNVLWCGSDRYWWHDFGTALAAARLLAPDPRFRFYLVGDVHAATPLPANTTVLGRLPAYRMPSIQSAMHAGLALYREAPEPYILPVATPRESGSPIKVFEYMASGLPIIASPLTQVTNLVFGAGTPGAVVGFGDAAGVAQALRNMADAPGEARRMGQDGRRLVETHYNWARVARQTAEAIGQLR